MSASNPKRLTYPAPRQCYEVVGYVSIKGKKSAMTAPHAWTESDVVDALRAGAYFIKGRHEFADAAAELAAGLGRGKREPGGSLNSWLKQMSPEQIEMLKEILSRETS